MPKKRPAKGGDGGEKKNFRENGDGKNRKGNEKKNQGGGRAGAVQFIPHGVDLGRDPSFWAKKA